MAATSSNASNGKLLEEPGKGSTFADRVHHAHQGILHLDGEIVEVNQTLGAQEGVVEDELQLDSDARMNAKDCVAPRHEPELLQQL